MPPTTSRAIVTRGPFSKGQWRIEHVSLRELGDDELEVQIVASGICATDLHFGDQEDQGQFGVFYPRVMGHEGSGYVRRVGSKVAVAKPGDPILLSYSYCGACKICSSGHPAHCTTFNDINFYGTPDFSPAENLTPVSRPTPSPEPSIKGSFFGQSSFSNIAIVSERSVVNVGGLIESEEDLKILAPLGCGVQTGSGTVINVAKAEEGDVVAVMGLGGVGLSAVMGAKLRNCRTIIGIDRVESRLLLAKELGATDVIDTSALSSSDELVERVRDVADGLGPSITVDATGYVPLIQKAVEFTRYTGKILQVGTAPPDAKLEIPVYPFMVAGKSYVGAVEGGAVSAEYVPRMVEWWKQGRFPVHRIVKQFKAEDFDKAIGEMRTGETVKPVIVW